MKAETTVLIVDDHAMLREGLRALIERKDDLRVVGGAGNGLEAIEQVKRLLPDIIVMDINMPELNGIEASRRILALSPKSRILALSIHSGKRYVKDMLEVGVSGYLLKKNAPEELIKAIYALREGKGYLSPDITEIVLERVRHTDRLSETMADKAMTAKLSRPPVHSSVHYPELIEQLEGGLDKKMTLVIAPTRSGKTSLVSAWLERCETPSAWLTLDKNDSSLRQFLISLLAAIHTLHPEACSQLQKMVAAADLAPVSVLAKTMLNELEHLPQHFLLILDDYDLASNKAISDLMSALVGGDLHPVHLVLITNKDPFLPISALLANDELNEIRMQALPERRATKANWREVLTNREYDILLLLEQRFRDKEIAEKLCISPGTVRSHTKNIYDKLGVNNRREAVIKASKLQLL